MITLEPDDVEQEDHALGQLGFEYDTEMLARFSSTCPNTVIDSSTVPKTEIEVRLYIRLWKKDTASNVCFRRSTG